MILARFILKVVGFRILAALAVLFVVLQVLDLLDATTDVLERGLGVGGVMRYAALRAPSLLIQAMPIAVLAGSLLAFTQLGRENAIIAMRASGISTFRLIGLSLPAALIVVATHLVIGQAIAPRTDAAQERWWRVTEPLADRKAPESRSFRVGADIVTATADPDLDTSLSDVRIYRRTPEGLLLTRTTASTARFDDGAWTLSDARTVTIAQGAEGVRDAARLTWPTTLRPVDIQTVFGDTATTTSAEAHRALREGAALRSPAFYQMTLQRAWSAPFASLVMLLLAIPVGLVSYRGAQAPVVLALCLGAGLLFLVVDGLLAAVGESGVLPVLLAAWGGPIVFAAAAMMVLLREEGA